MLAYQLLRWVGKRLEPYNDTREWKTIRRPLGTHRLVTTRLTLAYGRTINIRKPSQPDDEQKRVYQMLGIDWESAFPTKKTKVPALRDCSAFGKTLRVLFEFPAAGEKLGL